MDKHMDKERKWDALREGLREPETNVSESKKNNRRKIRAWMYTAIAVMLVMSASMGSAWAYFTSYAKAKGGVTLNLGHEEHLDEDFDSWEKVLDLSSTEDSNYVYLRARAFSAEYPVSYENSQNWTDGGDGWWYYNNTLAPGASLSDSGDQLKIWIKDVPKSDDPTLEDGKTFNVIVVYESTDVQYDDNGSQIAPTEADWSRDIESSRTSTTLGGEE